MDHRPVLITVVIVVALLLGVAGATAQELAPQGQPGSPDDTWHHEVVDPYGSSPWTSIALDAAGLPHVAYKGHDGQYRYSLKYARFDGITWHIESVDDEMATGWYPSLALDSQDEPHVAYHHAHDKLVYAHYYNSTWHIQTVDSGNDVGEHASLAVDSADLPHIAYSDETLHTVKYARRAGVTWQIATIAPMSAATQSISLDLALDSANRPHICYYDDLVDALKHAYYDGTAWHLETVASGLSSYNGQGCSIAIDSQDMPRITYRDLGLFYAFRDDVQWHTTEVDNDFFAGQESCLALTTDNQPRIVYSDWDYPNQDLRYAYFNGFDWEIEKADTSTQPGARAEGVSLALDSGGSPHISYYFDVNGPPLYAWKVFPPTRWLYLPSIRSR